MKLMEIIRKKKQVGLDQLIEATRKLQTKREQLDLEEEALKDEVKKLSLEVAVEDKGSAQLREVGIRRSEIGSKKEALDEALSDIKEELLSLLAEEKKNHLRELDKEQAVLREQEKKLLPELLRTLAKCAVLLEVTPGTTSADKWASKLLSADILGSVSEIIAKDRDRFKLELQKVKAKIQTGNIPQQLRAITEARAKLQRHSPSLEDVELTIQTGKAKWDFEREIASIRPNWSAHG